MDQLKLRFFLCRSIMLDRLRLDLSWLELLTFTVLSRSEAEKHHTRPGVLLRCEWMLNPPPIQKKKYVLQTISSKKLEWNGHWLSECSINQRGRMCSGVNHHVWETGRRSHYLLKQSPRRCGSDGNVINAHNKHCNQGRHFSRAKCLIHNSSLKITISVETEEGWL